MFNATSLVWAAIATIVAVFVFARIWSRRHAPSDASLGTVSDQWLAEQRLNRPDSQR
jgi:hypothetical protein